MPKEAKGPKPTKAVEPEYCWRDSPQGCPEVVWEHIARPLWVQSIPRLDGVLLIEKERIALRRASTGDVLWSESTTGLPDQVAVDETSLLTAWAAGLEARDLTSGKLAWRQRPGGVITSIELSPETAFVSTRGPLFALDRSHGKLRWRTSCAWEPELHHYPAPGLLLIDDPETESIRALDAATGAPWWGYAAEGQPVVAGPQVGDAVLISGHAAGVAAVHARTGEVLWKLLTERAFETPGVVSGDTVFCTDGVLHAHNAATGEERWQRTLDDEEDGFFALRVEHGILFAESWRGRLLALDPADGSLRWERRLGQVHGLVADARSVYLRVHQLEPAGRWAVIALDPASGELRWELEAKRMVPDITRFADLLVVELKPQVLVLRVD